jgi:Alpha 1,4-glycosyltransferase conserved region/Glycosyltransferase sugar-binding region containing DXD motif
MADSNQIIQSLWIGERLSTMEVLSIKSFLQNGHDYHLYVYGDVKNIPEGTTIKDGNEIVPSERIFTYQSGFGKGSHAGFANLFRFYLLKHYGNWWVDTDVICLKHFDFPEDTVISSSFEGKWGALANTCILKLPQESPLLDYLIEKSEDRDLSAISYGDIGPKLLQKAVADLGYKRSMAPYEAFCPITWRAVRKIVYHSEPLTTKRAIEDVKNTLRPFVRPITKPGRITRKSYAVHLWNEIWRQNNFDKDDTFDKNCLYEKLKRRYL